MFNTQTIERMETLRAKLREEHSEKLRERIAEKEDQLRERMAEKEDQLRERMAEREDHLREKLAEKDVHINSYLKQISDLQQQLKVSSFMSSCPYQSLDMSFPFQLAVEMNAHSLLQYKQLAELQEARMEIEREKIALGSELMVVKR